MSWTVAPLDEAVEEELAALPADMRARFQRIAALIREFGVQGMREPYVKHLEGPLWEIRLKGRGGIARALYVTATGRRVVVVRVFVKKTQRIPRREIALALRRAEGIER